DQTSFRNLIIAPCRPDHNGLPADSRGGDFRPAADSEFTLYLGQVSIKKYNILWSKKWQRAGRCPKTPSFVTARNTTFPHFGQVLKVGRGEINISALFAGYGVDG